MQARNPADLVSLFTTVPDVTPPTPNGGGQNFETLVNTILDEERAPEMPLLWQLAESMTETVEPTVEPEDEAVSPTEDLFASDWEKAAQQVPLSDAGAAPKPVQIGTDQACGHANDAEEIASVAKRGPAPVPSDALSGPVRSVPADQSNGALALHRDADLGGIPKAPGDQDPAVLTAQARTSGAPAIGLLRLAQLGASPDMPRAPTPPDVVPMPDISEGLRIGKDQVTSAQPGPVATPSAVQSTLPEAQVMALAQAAERFRELPAKLEAETAFEAAAGGSETRGPTSSAASLPPAPASLARPWAIAQQLAIAVSRAPGGETEITLRPDELGRVKLSLSGPEGALNVSILADRPETQELIRRHLDALAAEFRQLGYDSLSFDFGPSGGGAETGQDDQPSRDDFASSTDRPVTPTGAPVSVPTTSVSKSGGLDLRL